MIEYCKYCSSKISNLNHFNICIYYKYHSKYTPSETECSNGNDNVSNITIQNVIEISNLFDLYKYDIYTNFSINILIKKLIIKSKINNQINANTIVTLINLINNNNSTYISYNSLLDIIELITNTNKKNIINIINSYKECYNSI